jgi:hypothetical protein
VGLLPSKLGGEFSCVLESNAGCPWTPPVEYLKYRPLRPFTGGSPRLSPGHVAVASGFTDGRLIAADGAAKIGTSLSAIPSIGSFQRGGLDSTPGMPGGKENSNTLNVSLSIQYRPN